MKRVLILSCGSVNVSYAVRSAMLRDLVETLNADDGLMVAGCMLEDLGLTIVGGEINIEFKGFRDFDFDAIYIKNWFGQEHIARAVTEFAKLHKVPVICSEASELPVKEKISEGFVLSRNGLPYPDTIYSANTKKLLELFSSQHFTFPVIVKSIFGFKGKDNFLAQSIDELKEIIGASKANRFMIQEYIPNDGDFRLIVLGDKITLAIHRTRADSSTHMNNTSQGGFATLVPTDNLSKIFTEIALKSSKVLAREVAGVDLLMSKDGSRVAILEVNASPQLQTGAFHDEKIVSLGSYLKSLSSWQNREIVGVSSLVDFVGYKNLKAIPARIDTGARTSSLWASDVSIKKGVATFKLFGPGSPWYTGKVVRRKVIELREVTSSTGHVQERHVVTLPVRIHGKRLNAKFTLSDRSTQTYPILIGRNTLRGNFLVDSGDPGEAKLYKYPEEASEFNESEAA